MSTSTPALPPPTPPTSLRPHPLDLLWMVRLSLFIVAATTGGAAASFGIVSAVEGEQSDALRLLSLASALVLVVVALNPNVGPLVRPTPRLLLVAIPSTGLASAGMLAAVAREWFLAGGMFSALAAFAAVSTLLIARAAARAGQATFPLGGD